MNDITLAAVQHYDRMILWAHKQNPKGIVDIELMHKEIEEVWQGTDCPFCNEYGIDDLGSCGSCPLYARDNAEHCCDGRWSKMCKACTWSEWIWAAEMVKLYIIEHGDLK